MESTDFSYDGIYSRDKGVLLVSLEDGLVTTPFMAEREIISDSVYGNPIPYYYGVIDQPLRVTLTLAILGGKWTLAKRREIARWLDCRRFAEFYSADETEKRYFLTYEGGIDLATDATQQGYIQVKFRNIGPYAYSPVFEKHFDLSNNTSKKTIEFEHDGDNDLYPELLWIQKIGRGDLTIRNLSNGGRVFSFTDLLDQEELRVNNQRRSILTSLSNTYRYDQFNGNYIKLVRGLNRLEVEGAARLGFTYRHEIKG